MRYKSNHIFTGPYMVKLRLSALIKRKNINKRPPIDLFRALFIFGTVTRKFFKFICNNF